MKKLDILAAVLLVVGGLNWGLVAVAEFDLVAALVGLDFGETNAASRVIYGLVGLAAVYQVVQQGAIRRRWSRNPQVTTVERRFTMTKLVAATLTASVLATAAFAAAGTSAAGRPRGRLLRRTSSNRIAAGQFKTLVMLAKRRASPALSPAGQS